MVLKGLLGNWGYVRGHPEQNVYKWRLLYILTCHGPGTRWMEEKTLLLLLT